MKRKFEYHGHIITHGRNLGGQDVVQSATCSLPYSIAEAVKFMVNYNVRHLIIDSQEVRAL